MHKAILRPWLGTTFNKDSNNIVQFKVVVNRNYSSIKIKKLFKRRLKCIQEIKIRIFITLYYLNIAFNYHL